MWFIGKRIAKGYISPATGRAIELWILGTVSALAIWLLDNVDVMLNWWTIDWETFIVTFSTSTALTFTAWMRKQARDLKPIEEEGKSGLI